MVSKHVGLLRLTLRRPQAFHALTTEMCGAITEQVKRRQHGALLVTGGEGCKAKAFCAGTVVYFALCLSPCS